MNALVGLRRTDLALDDQLELARETIAWTADLAAKPGVTVLIEAVNTFENGPYLLHTTPQAAQFVASVGQPNVRLQYDVYHMQRMEGNLTANLRHHIGSIEHVQVADSPGRGAPGTGEIHFPFLFRELERLDYQGYVGLEYKPGPAGTEASLRWLPEAGRAGGIATADLDLPGAREAEGAHV